MSIYKAKAIVLRVIKYNEADKIVHLLSPQGRINAIAKGSRKVKSKLSGTIEPFCLASLVLYKGRNLDTITQADLIKSYKKIRLDYQKFLVASSILELVDKVTFKGQSEEAIFTLLEQMLEHLNSAQQNGVLSLLFFDWQVIKALGLLPNLSVNPAHLTISGTSGQPSTVNGQPRPINIKRDKQSTVNRYIWFDLAEGSLLNTAGSNSCIKVESLTIKLLKSIISSNLEHLGQLKLADKQLRELVLLTERYLKYQLQVNLKSRSYLEQGLRV